ARRNSAANPPGSCRSVCRRISAPRRPSPTLPPRGQRPTRPPRTLVPSLPPVRLDRVARPILHRIADIQNCPSRLHRIALTARRIGLGNRRRDWSQCGIVGPHAAAGATDARKARLRYGPGLLSWSPIVTRPVLRWPEGARVALAVIVNLEHWDWEVPEGTPLAVSPMGGPEGIWTGNQPNFPDIGGYGNHEYRNPVGGFRILAVPDKYRITPTLALGKTVAHHYPSFVKE